MDGKPCYHLAGRPVRPGVGLEAWMPNGWLLGTFYWSGRDADRPRLIVTLLDEEVDGDLEVLEVLLNGHSRARWPRETGRTP